MKKMRFIFAFLAMGLLTIASCEDDGGDSVISLNEGAVPNILKVTGSNTFIDLIALESGEETTINFTVDKGQGNIASMDVVLFYKSGTTVYRTVLESNVTTFPKAYSLTQFDIIEAFTELNSAADFQVGDVLSVSADITLTNGSKLNILNNDATPNFGQDIANSAVYKVFQNYIVSCPSDLGGTYNFVSTNIGEPGGFVVPGPETGTVTFTDNGGGVYAISDGSFGGWEALYGPPGASGVTLIDICNTLSFGGSDDYGDTYTISNVITSGSNLSFSWSNTYGEYGSTTLTRTDGTDWPDLTN